MRRQIATLLAALIVAVVPVAVGLTSGVAAAEDCMVNGHWNC